MGGPRDDFLTQHCPVEHRGPGLSWLTRAAPEQALHGNLWLSLQGRAERLSQQSPVR